LPGSGKSVDDVANGDISIEHYESADIDVHVVNSRPLPTSTSVVFSIDHMYAVPFGLIKPWDIRIEISEMPKMRAKECCAVSAFSRNITEI